MIERYIQLNRILRSIVYRARDGEDADQHSTDSFALGSIASYIVRDVRDLERLWPPELTAGPVRQLRQLADQKDAASFRSMVEEAIPDAENALDEFYSRQPAGDIKASILDFLHPVVIESAYAQFRNGHYRDAVFNALVAVFDLIRRRTGVDKDGAELVADAFSLTSPKLVISSLDTESGRNEQKGFIQILQGAFLGIRNPKAHSLESDLDASSAAQYLLFASLLARRIAEAHPAGA